MIRQDLPKVMTLMEVARSAALSLSTLLREIARGMGPKVVLLSSPRKGVRSTDYDTWLDLRTNVAHQ